jgi:hypothetical protein
MRMDPIVKRELDLLPVPYEIRKSKDHYFVVIDGHKPICVGGNHDKHGWRLSRATSSQIKKIRRTMEKADGKA